MEDLSARLATLAAFWNQIEKRVKEVEQLRSGRPAIPAINELRYAGRKFVDAWSYIAKPNPSDEDNDNCEECIVVANQYLINADHDAIDAALVFVYRTVYDVKKKYGAKRLLGAVPNFLDILDEIDLYKSMVSTSREDRAKRTEIYTEIIPHFDRMMIVYKKIDQAERHLLARVKMWDFFKTIFAILGITGSIASLFGIYFIFHPLN